MSGCGSGGTVGGVPVGGGGGSGVNEIGPAEDGTYTDGVFTDLVTNTPIGTPIDRFNEVLLSLVPKQAPDLDKIDISNSGASGILSFGASQGITGYTNVNGIGNLPPVDINSSYQESTISTDERKGIFNGIIGLSGELNPDVSADGTNYPAKSFRRANEGEIRLLLNGSLFLTLTLQGAGSGALTVTSPNGSDISVSALKNAEFANGDEFPTYKSRTGTFFIDGSDQINGWNYIQIAHRRTIGDSGTDVLSNYVGWVVDRDNTAITVSGDVLDNLLMSGSLFLTGVEYFTSGHADYDITINDAYRNTYSGGDAITFDNSENISIPNQSLSSISVGSQDETKLISFVDLTATINVSKLLDGYITAKVSVEDPLDDELIDGGVQSIDEILLFDKSSASTVLFEDFIDESFRIEPSNYDLQSDVSSNPWVSSTDRSGGGSLVVYDESLVGIISLPNNGDFSILGNGPSGNVDYSSISGNLTYYRKFQNNTGGSKQNFDLLINGIGTIVQSSSLLGNNDNFFIEFKLPEKTGWGTLIDFDRNPIADGDGILDGELSDTLSTTNELSFGSQVVEKNEYIVMKITANYQWTGNIDDITLTWK